DLRFTRCKTQSMNDDEIPRLSRKERLILELLINRGEAYGLELVKPWRKDQPKIRLDFRLDGFYMFFNFFIFPLILYNAVSNVAAAAFNDFLALFGIRNWTAVSVASLPKWGQLLLMLLLRDFIQWNIHRLLHRVPQLWEFHKVHHSVKQMGFAAHLRFHWMENVLYRTLEFIPLGIIGFGVQDFFIVHIFALTVGHFNHSNFRLPLGPLKYIFNNPQMHIWHHAKKLPKKHYYGCNYGISLSLWDYLFKTSYIPYSGRDIVLGFHKDKNFPKRFFTQAIYPWSRL
ncbi:MAG: sterol desaturase family protein, partial [bacterium]|nr:sterol desaturase family protein [bacterium]